MKRFISFIIAFLMLTTLVSCKKDEDEVVARINGEEIRMSHIQDDVDFVIGIQNIDKSDQEAYRAIVLDVINAYLIDLMCQKEMDALGLRYNSDYYGASMESLIEAYGSYDALLRKISAYGLGEDYINKVCKNKANKATLSEHIASQVTVDEADILQFYIENVDDFTVDEARGMYVLFFETEDAAKAALLDIEASNFIEYYKQQDILSTTVAHVHFDTVSKDEFPEEIGTPLFELDLNTYHSEPIACNLGFALIYVDQIKKNYTYTYEEMKESIEIVMLDELADKAMEDYFEDLNNKYVVELLYGME